jgi:SAM-dependent methyltransferase
VEEDKRSAFWNERLRLHGHTGWSDPVIYIFDQQERLSLIRHVLGKETVKHGAALDFGCGTGDFSRLLISCGFKVCGYDPYVRPKIKTNEFNYAANFEQIINGVGSLDLAISITTLDHILEKNEVQHAFAFIHKYLKPNGIFYMLEYALDSETDRDTFAFRNDYMSFRTLSQWKDLLSQTSFRVLDIRSVSHPGFSSSAGYATYIRHPLVQFRRRFSHLPFVPLWCDPLLRRYAQTLIKAFPPWIQSGASSPLKLIRCIPIPR